MLLLRLQHLQAQVKRDPLTGLLNYRAFYDELAGAALPMALLLLDVDDFKPYNDSFGHQAGDRVLAALAQLIAAEVREGDLVARCGGEEFAVICPRTDQETALALAERIRREVSGRVLGLRRITVSIGVAAAPTEAERSGIVQAADTCLYMAKRLGKDRMCAHAAEGPAQGTSPAPCSGGMLPGPAGDGQAVLEVLPRLLGLFTACTGAAAGFVECGDDAGGPVAAVLGTTGKTARRILDGLAGDAGVPRPSEPYCLDLNNMNAEADARIPFASLIAIPVMVKSRRVCTLYLLFDQLRPLSPQVKAALRTAGREAESLILTITDLEARALWDRSPATGPLSMRAGLPGLPGVEERSAGQAFPLPLHAGLDVLHWIERFALVPIAPP